jgi:hypothetical protein
MANETLSTSVPGLVRTELLEPLVLSFLYAHPIIAPHARAKVIAQSDATKVWRVGTVAKPAVAAKSEGTPLDNTAFQVSSGVTVTAAEVGVLFNVSHLARESNLYGDGLEGYIAQKAGISLMDKLETDLANLYDGFATTAGATGVEITVATFVTAKGKLRINNARGPAVAVLHPKVSYDLEAAIASTTGAVFANTRTDQSLLNAGADDGGHTGGFFGVKVCSSSNVKLINGSADRACAMYIDGNASPEFAAQLLAIKWLPRVFSGPDPANNSQMTNVTMCYGVAEGTDLCGVLITAKA